MKHFFGFLFFVVSMVELSAHLLGTGLNVYSKPLLMPVLLMYFLASYQYRFSQRSMLVVMALVFSCAGDVSLMGLTSTRFIIGLTCFLLAHVAYIVMFIRERSSDSSHMRFSWKLLFPMVLYILGLMYFLIPGSGPMAAPVVIYGLTILVMWYTASLRFGTRAAYQNWSIILGAALFVISDSMIGINKFYLALPQSDFLIMLTYIGGQFLIINGLINHFHRTNPDSALSPQSM